MKDKYKKAFLVYIIFCSLEFMRFFLIKDSIRSVIQFSGVAVTILLLIAYYVYYRKDEISPVTKIFAGPVSIILLAVTLSTISASVFHSQSYPISLWASRFMYFYLFYFLLHKLELTCEEMQKLALSIALTYVSAFMIQYMLYPKVIFQTRLDLDRGTVRIFLPGMSFVVLSFFYSISQFFKTYKKYYLALFLAFLSIFILTATRQLIFSVLFLTFLYILTSKTVKSKIVFIFLGVLAIIPLYFAFEGIFSEMFALSEEQGDAGLEENIRYRAAKYFLTEFMPHPFTYVLGNGESYHTSPFGAQVLFYKLNFGYYQSDVGLVGEYSKFGALYIIGVLIILGKVFLTKLPDSVSYIRYGFLLILFTLFSGKTDFGVSDLSMITSLYLIDRGVYEQSLPLEKDPNTT